MLVQHKSKNHQIREALRWKLVEDAANSDLDARDLSVNSVSEENCSEDENDPIGDFEELENFINNYHQRRDFEFSRGLRRFPEEAAVFSLCPNVCIS